MITAFLVGVALGAVAMFGLAKADKRKPPKR